MIGIFALIAFIIWGCITQGVIACCSCCCQRTWVESLSPTLSLDMFFEKEVEDLNIQYV